MRMKKLFKRLCNEHAIWVIGLVASLTWVWAFFVDASKLSESLVVGYGGVFAVYVVIITLTTIIAYLIWTIIRKLLDRPSWMSLAQIVLLWASGEFIIAWIASITSMGHGSSWDSMFPLFSLAPFIAYTPLRFLFRIFGFFGTSAVIGTSILVIFYGKPWRTIAIRFGMFLMLANVVLYGFYNHTTGGYMDMMIVSEKLGEIQRIDTGTAEFVLVPEYGIDSVTPDGIANRFNASDKEVLFSGTMHVPRNGKYYNTLIYGSTTKGVIEQHDKSRLVIGSEYLPHGVEFALKNFAPETYYNFLNRRAIAPGKETPPPFKMPNGELLGNAACSSILSTDDYRKLARAGATMLANSASLGVFNGSRQFEFYHSGLAKFMAIANARPFMQSANDWKSFVLDHNGREIAEVIPTGTEVASVSSNRKTTPYTIVGELVAYTGVLLLTLKVSWEVRNKRPCIFMKRKARLRKQEKQC